MDVHIFEHKTFKYQVRSLNVFDQLELARKLTPMLVLIGDQQDKDKIKTTFKQFFTASTANLNKDALQEIFNMTLVTVYRQTKGGWQPIYSNANLLFNDIKLGDMLLIIYEVLEANELLDFFTGNPFQSVEEKPKDQI
jgi:hypothetical protein